jgi:outer membrane protein
MNLKSWTWVLFILLLPIMSSAQTGEPFRIGIVAGNSGRNIDEIHQLFIDEIKSVVGDEFDITFPESAFYIWNEGDPSIKDNITTLMSRDDVDMVLSIDFLSSWYLLKCENITKPSIATCVSDYDLDGMSVKDGISGLKNLNYINAPRAFFADFLLLKELIPVNHITVLINESVYDDYVHYTHVTSFLEEEMGCEIILKKIGKEIETTVTEIVGTTDVVVIGGHLNYNQSDFLRLVESLKVNKIPSFSVLGVQDVEHGILAGTATSDFYLRRARRTALNVQRILLGEKAEDIPVAFSDRNQLSINMATARAIGVSPPWSLVTESNLIDDTKRENGRSISLVEAVREAVSSNLDILVKQKEVRSGSKEVQKAWANLLPQLKAGITHLTIDDDRAASSMGSASEKSLTGSLTLEQILFSDIAWSNRSIQKSIQISRKEAFEQVSLDITLETTEAFLNVLRSRVLEKIYKDNLLVTRSNLELAQIRKSIGVAGPAEVYRWEAQIASDRKAVIQANSQRNLAEIQLNRLVHHPLEEPFIPEPLDVDSPRNPINDEAYHFYISSSRRFDILRNALVEIGLEKSPELKQIDAAIAAQKTLLGSKKRSVFIPTIAAQAKFDRIMDKSGEGSEGMNTSAIPPPFDTIFPEPADENSWSVALNASLPLFQGGSRFAEIAQIRFDLEKLEIQRKSVSEKLEQRIRSASHMAGAKFAAINLSKDASIAASKTLEVVTDAYALGTLTILDLIDAQNATLVTQQAYVNSIYNFLIDFANVQRSIGRFYIFDSDAELMEARSRIDQYYIQENEIR